MAIEVKYDRIEGHEYVDGPRKQLIRTAIITGLTYTTDEYRKAAVMARDAITESRGDDHPDDSALKLHQITVKPVPGCRDAFAAQLLYREPTTGSFSGASVTIVRDRGYEEMEATQVHPITKNLISIDGFKYPADLDADSIVSPLADTKVTGSVGAAAFAARRRVVSLYRITSSYSGAGTAASVTNVNNATWMGYGVGFWRLTEFEKSSNIYTGWDVIQATALSLVNRPHYHLQFLFDQLTGKFVTGSTLQTSVTALTNLTTNPYGSADIYKEPGVTRWDPYDAVDFDDIFGFSTMP